MPRQMWTERVFHETKYDLIKQQLVAALYDSSCMVCGFRAGLDSKEAEASNPKVWDSV